MVIQSPPEILKGEDWNLKLIDSPAEILARMDAGAKIVVITTTHPDSTALMAEIRNRHPDAFVILWTGCSYL